MRGSLISLLFGVIGFLGVTTHAEERPSYNLLLADHTARHLYLYSHERGVVWRHSAPALFDACVLKDGTIVHTTRSTVDVIKPDIKAGQGGEQKTIYRYGTGYAGKHGKLPKGMIYTCGLQADGHFLITESGTCRLVEMTRAGKIVRTIKLPKTEAPVSQSLRLARKSPDGFYYVPYFGEGKILKIDTAGKVVESINVNEICGFSAESVYETFFLPNNELLISCGPQNQIIRLDKNRKVVWTLGPEDVPGINLDWITSLYPRPNGNIIICNYCKGKAKIKAFEIDKEKNIVWQLTDPEVKGLTKLQVLDKHFSPLQDSGLHVRKPADDSLKSRTPEEALPNQ